MPLVASHSLYWFLLIIGLAFSITYFIYFKSLQNQELSVSKVYLLSGLRLFILISLGFLLLGPLIRIIKAEIQKPVIIYAQDNSESMLLSADSTYLRDSFPAKVSKLLNRLSDKFEVHSVQFGDSVTSLTNTFTDKNTNFESLFKIFETTYFNQNIGALIIASDGLYNKGNQPLYAAMNLPFPIYTIPFGDTLPKADISITRVENNPVVYKGSNFPLSVGVSVNNMENSKVTVDVFRDKNLVESKTLVATNPLYFKNVLFTLPADSAGLFPYHIKASATSVEANLINNTKTVYIEVEENKRKILLIQNGYHPDVALFKRVLESNSVYNLEIKNAGEVTSVSDTLALVILHQLPSSANNLQNIMPELIKNDVPILFVLGQETAVNALNNLKLPLSIQHKNNLFDDAQPVLNSNFNLFNTSIDARFLADMPPLYTPFGEYSVFQQNQVLLYQKIGSIETDKPLWAFSNAGQQKLGFILGEGLWKWQLQEYKNFHDHSITSELIFKTIQYLALKNKKEPFSIDYSKTFAENQDIIFSAKLLNASNEMINGASIKLEIIDSKGNTYPHYFDETGEGYQLNMGSLPVGKYKFKAKTESGNKVYEKSGIFIVKENLIEQLNLTADFNMLFNLSVNSGGKQYSKLNTDSLYRSIDENENILPVKIVKKTLTDFIEFKWLLALFVIFLCLEWFLRRIWGLI